MTSKKFCHFFLTNGTSHRRRADVARVLLHGGAVRVGRAGGDVRQPVLVQDDPARPRRQDGPQLRHLPEVPQALQQGQGQLHWLVKSTSDAEVTHPLY